MREYTIVTCDNGDIGAFEEEINEAAQDGFKAITVWAVTEETETDDDVDVTVVFHCLMEKDAGVIEMGPVETERV